MDIELTQLWQFVLVALLVFAVAGVAWRNSLWGAALVLFLLPTYLFRIRVVESLPTNVLELLLLTWVAARLVWILRKSEFSSLIPQNRGVWAPFGLMVFGAAVSAVKGLELVAGDLETQRLILGSLKGFVLEPILFIFILAGLFRHYGSRTSIVMLRTYIGSAVGVASIALVGGLLSLGALPYAESVTSFLTFDGRLRGFYLSPNHLAMYVQPALALVAAYGIRLIASSRPKKRKSMSFLLLAISSVALFATLLWTKSAGALTGLTAGLMAYSLWLIATRRDSLRLQYTMRYSLYAIVLVGVLLPFLAVSFSEALIELDERSPLASRSMIWRAATEMLKEHWFFGIGPGAFPYHYLELQEKFPPYLEWAAPQPHNLFLAFWLQTGLLGLIGFLWLLVGVFRRHLAYSTPPFVLAALAAIVVHGFVDTPFWKNDLAIVTFLLVISAAQASILDHKSSEIRQ